MISTCILLSKFCNAPARPTLIEMHIKWNTIFAIDINDNMTGSSEKTFGDTCPEELIKMGASPHKYHNNLQQALFLNYKKGTNPCVVKVTKFGKTKYQSYFLLNKILGTISNPKI